MKTLADEVTSGDDGAVALREAGSPLARRLTLAPQTAPETAQVEHFRCRCRNAVPLARMLDLEPPHVPTELHLTPDERAAAGFGTDRYRGDCCWRPAVLRGSIDPDRLREATGQKPRRIGDLW